tara:strand:- start:12981 stop:14201 length:1221 start_codon:yes stop_codon:yes gene_type:complete
MKTSLLKKISKKYDGPKYVYNLNEISHSYRSLKKSLPTFSKLYYSMKANPNEGVVSYLHKLGAGIECSSWGEISKALKSGVNKKNIIFTGPAKKNEELIQFIKRKIGIISIESLNEFKRLSFLSKKLNRNINCIIRINPENMDIKSSIKMMGVSSQFGIDSKKFLQNYKLFNSNKTNILGFHFYSASNVISNKDLLKMFFNCIDLSLKIEKLLKIKIKLLNLGGGFASPYGRKGKRKNYSNIKKPLEKKLINSFGEERVKSLNLIFESGRYLVGTCGGLICKVVDKKISKNKKYIILDSGINNLAGMSSINRLPKLDPEIVLINRKEKKKETFDIVGPLCTPLDFWSRSALSYKLKINDIIFVPNVSSYGLSASLILFLSYDIPNELLLLNNKLFKTYKHYLNCKN